METQMAGSISRLDGSMSQDAVFKDIPVSYTHLTLPTIA